MAQWALVVTERDGTELGTIDSDTEAVDQVLAAAGHDPLLDVGISEILCKGDSALNTLFAEDRLVHLYVRDTYVMSLSVDAPDEVLISPQGPAGANTTHHLRTLSAVLAEGVVTPPRGSGSKPVGSDRIFDSSDPAWDATGQPTAQSYGTVTDMQSLYPVTPYGVGNDGDAMPDPDGTDVIAPNGTDVDEDAPSGRCYFGKDFNIPSASGGRCGIWCNVDNGGETRLDGVTVIPFTIGFGTAAYAEVVVTSGDHRMWVVGENQGAPGAGPLTVALEMWLLDAAGNPVEKLLSTDDTWWVVEFPDNPPGFTPLEITELCVVENQSRGALGGVRVDGIPSAFTETWDISTKSTTPLTTFFLRELAEQYADFETWFDFDTGEIVVEVLPYGERGAVIPSGAGPGQITFDTSNIGSLVVNGARTEATAFWAQWNDGGEAVFNLIAVAPASGHPRKEAPLTLGAQRSLPELTRTAESQLGFFGRTRSKISLTHLVNATTPDDKHPGTGYWTGDTLPVPYNRAFDVAPVRVIAMGWALVEGRMQFSIELGDVVVPVASRSGLALKKLAQGVLGGQSKRAAPVNIVNYTQTTPGIPA